MNSTRAEKSAATTQSVMDFALGLLALTSEQSLQSDNHLRELSKVFGASGVGFAGLLANRVPTVQHWASADGAARGSGRWPWEEWPEQLAELLKTPEAVPLV